ncbi:hypothetical protein J7L09_00065 [bacterium]|nr:hypothetical protein [bacterium]
MELKGPTIERAVCEILYPGTLVYHEKRATLCKKFIDKLPHWFLNISILELYDQSKPEEAEKIFQIGSKRAFLLYKNPGVYDNFIALASDLICKSIDELEIETIQRLGIRTFYFIETDISFIELKDILIERLFNKENTNRIGNINDLSWVSVILEKEYNLRISVGPLSPEEIKKGYYLKKEEVNPTLLIDVDCFRKDLSIKSVKEIKEALRFSKEKGNEVVDNICSILRS